MFRDYWKDNYNILIPTTTKTDTGGTKTVYTVGKKLFAYILNKTQTSLVLGNQYGVVREGFLIAVDLDEELKDNDVIMITATEYETKKFVKVSTLPNINPTQSGMFNWKYYTGEWFDCEVLNDN